MDFNYSLFVFFPIKHFLDMENINRGKTVEIFHSVSTIRVFLPQIAGVEEMRVRKREF